MNFPFGGPQSPKESLWASARAAASVERNMGVPHRFPLPHGPTALIEVFRARLQGRKGEWNVFGWCEHDTGVRSWMGYL